MSRFARDVEANPRSVTVPRASSAMRVAVVARLCHALAGSPPVCREEVVADDDMSIGLGCLIAEAKTVTEWKAHSIYAGDQWTIQRVFCAPGGYTPKEPA